MNFPTGAWNGPMGITPVSYNMAGNMAAWNGGTGQYADVDARHNLPPGTTARIVGVESGGNRLAISKKGAMGLGQIMPGTWARFGHGDPWNANDLADASASYMQYLLGLFGGNMEEALAGYNAGEASVMSALSKAAKGGDWRTFLPMETQDYLRKFGYGMRQVHAMATHKAGSLSISIHNNTGGSATVSALQLA